jgi:hypothetical protein
MDGWVDGCLDECAHLLVTELVGFYSYVVLKSLAVPGQCLVNLNIPAPKNRGRLDGPQNKMAIFLNDLD